jgi:hypothetical protein
LVQAPVPGLDLHSLELVLELVQSAMWSWPDREPRVALPSLESDPELASASL